jgi:uncharacterized damage-inducible protein DinB
MKPEQILKFIKPAEPFKGELGNWISALDEVRQLTQRAVSGLTPNELAWMPHPKGNTIGQLLRHIALVELDWILTDICRGEPLPPDAPEMLRLEGPMSDPGRCSLEEFMTALDFARTVTKHRLSRFGASECDSTRECAGENSLRVFNVRWIFFHLVEHEAHHKGQILFIRQML